MRLLKVLLISVVTVLTISSGNAETNQNTSILPGNWVGKITSINGFDGSLKMTLSVKNNQVQGSCYLEIFDEESSIKYKGIVTGNIFNSGINIEAELGEKEKIKLYMKGKVAGALPYAEQAYSGSYTRDPDFYLGNGVFILWRFKNR